MKHRITAAMAADVAVIALFLILFVVKATAMPGQRAADTLYPRPLRPGDKIAILAPAGPIDSLIVDSAAAVLRQVGYEPVIYPHTFGKHGHFSGTHSERLADMRAALCDTSIRAILCARGGYGVVHNLDSLAMLPLRDDPKWIIGFSDISALHALMASHGIASVHASMAKQVMLGPDDELNSYLLDILQGRFPTYRFAPNEYNHPGHAEGKLLGGNLAVIADLIATPFDIIQPGTILFIEDVSEPIYKIERIIYQLRLMGILPKLKGLIIGQFTDYKPDKVHESMEQMLAEALAPYPELPVAFGAPIGHVDYNLPVVESAYATLDITPEGVTLAIEP
ncbi:MAG: LD-carboxypeptidase [Muribaculaceae bacterium]|nr:LD-carboxypeptidase [Muribaculaceae bacterium]